MEEGSDNEGSLFEEGDEGFDTEQEMFAEPQTRYEMDVEDHSDISTAALEDAERQKSMEDIETAQNQIANDEEQLKRKHAYSTLDDELNNIDRDVAGVFKEVKGFKKFIYDVASRFGKNLYANDVRNHRSGFEQRYTSLEKTLAGFKTQLHKDTDSDPHVDVSEKGVEAKMNSYKKVCRGIAQTMNRVDSMVRGLERQKSETKLKIDEYLQLTREDPGNEEHGNKLQYYQSRQRGIDEDIIKLQKDKRLQGTKLKSYHGVASTLELQYQNTETNILQAEEALIKVRSIIDLLDHYLDSCTSAKSLAAFQREMSSLNEEIKDADAALDIYVNRTTRALERNLDDLRKRSSNGDPTKYLQGVKSSQSRLLAAEDRKIKDLVDHYS